MQTGLDESFNVHQLVHVCILLRLFGLAPTPPPTHHLYHPKMLVLSAFASMAQTICICCTLQLY